MLFRSVSLDSTALAVLATLAIYRLWQIDRCVFWCMFGHSPQCTDRTASTAQIRRFAFILAGLTAWLAQPAAAEAGQNFGVQQALFCRLCLIPYCILPCWSIWRNQRQHRRQTLEEAIEEANSGGYL